MPPKKDPNALTPFQKAFASAYVSLDCNGTRAYRSLRPHVRDNVAAVKACELVRIGKVRAEIERLQREAFKREHMTPEEVIAELSRIARADLSQCVDENGALLPLREMPVEVRRAISSLEVERSIHGTKRKIRLWDKTGALNTLAKHLKLINDKSDVHVHVTLEELIGGVDKDAEGEK